MTTSTRCRAHDRTTCRHHGVPKENIDLNSYLSERYEADQKKKEQESTLAYISETLTQQGWEEYEHKVRKFIQKLTKQYGTPDIGRTRAVFDLGDGTVMKVPYTNEGEMANGRENKASSEENPFIPVATSHYEQHDGVDVLIMEKIEIADVDYKNMPQWVGYVDCGQVGYNSKKELVAYDL